MRSGVFLLVIGAALAPPFAFGQEISPLGPPAACAPAGPVPLVAPQVLGNGTPASVTTADIQAALDTGGHIRFNVGAAPVTIDITSELVVTKAAVLDGGGNVTLSGRFKNRVIHVVSDAVPAQSYLFGLQNIRIAYGFPDGGSGAGLLLTSGGGDWQAVDLRIVNVTFFRNQTALRGQDGGGIYALGARSLLVANSVFESNYGSNGGGLYSLGARSVTIVGSRFRLNSAEGIANHPGMAGYGGAIGVDGAERTVTICGTRILENFARFGAGFFSVGYDSMSPTTFYRTQFQGNRQGFGTGSGAGAYLENVPFTIAESAFISNSGRASGGLHLGPGSTGTIENTTFHWNTADEGLGGAIGVGTEAPVTIVNSTIVSNRVRSAVPSAGGIDVGPENALTVRNVILAGNYWGDDFPRSISRTVAGSHVVQFGGYRPAPIGQEEPAAVASNLIWAEPQIDPAGPRGGPTWSMALRPGSPARDAGTATGAPTVDQRGVARDATPDIGAYEVSNDVIFADDFDSVFPGGWSSSQTDGGDLEATSYAGLAPSISGMRALVDDTKSLFVTDNSPDDEDRYRARFYFDPSGFDPGEPQGHHRMRIFLAFEEAPARRLLAIVLRRVSGAYSLQGRVRLDDASWASTGFSPITGTPHFVEIDWKRSSGPGANDGSFQMWIDGTSVSTLSGLDNRSSSVDFVRLGAMSLKAGAAGTLSWDDFESRRVSLIGP